ncbi:MarR family transcriptional regulator [Cellulomonas fimi]|uniref:MarR family transcriptional regulator n=1 Tax=Cellulomonas fimi TaxID=1708 RepID=A0A7Y0M0Q9_CELFI|nr:MarR family transcriptional regulator [Cellulomonas fimi]
MNWRYGPSTSRIFPSQEGILAFPRPPRGNQPIGESRLSHGELTSLLLFTGPATTKRLRRLEAGGWIQRTANPADGRGVLLQPTPDGARRFGALLPGYLALEASLIDHLAARDREDLTVLLRRLLSRWEAARR